MQSPTSLHVTMLNAYPAEEHQRRWCVEMLQKLLSMKYLMVHCELKDEEMERGKQSGTEEIEHSRDQEGMIQLVELDVVVLGARHGIHQRCEVVGGLKLLVEVGSVLDEMFLVVELEALSTDAKEVVLAA